MVFLFLLQSTSIWQEERSGADNKLSKREERDFLKTVFEKTVVHKSSLEKQNDNPKPSWADDIPLDCYDQKPKPYKKKKSQKKIQHHKICKKNFIKTEKIPDKKIQISQSKKDRSFKDLAKKIEVKTIEEISNKKLADSLKPDLEEEFISYVPIKTEPKLRESYKLDPFKNIKPNQKCEYVAAGSSVPQKAKIEIKKKKFGFFNLKDLQTTSCSENFDTDLVFLPKEDGSGYIFALTLIPKPYVDFPKIKQNYFFLLDRSNGIGKKRFHVTQSAILKALANLPEGDTFNILAFDNQVELMSPYNLNQGKNGLVQAKRFLDNLYIGSIFTSSNLTLPLYSVLSYPNSSEEINIAILLTNGDGIAEVFNNRMLVDEWSVKNNGKVCLHSLCLDSDKEQLMMEMFSAFNQGKVTSSSTVLGLKRKLLKLMKQLKNPIAKDVRFTAVSKNNDNPIELYTYLKPPHLYLDDPYVIMGSVKNLDDFVLFIQGKRNKQFLNIKKDISFVNARAGHRSLRKQYAMQMAFEKYQHFVYEKDPKYITEMKNLLAPYHIDTAFQ